MILDLVKEFICALAVGILLTFAELVPAKKAAVTVAYHTRRMDAVARILTTLNVGQTSVTVAQVMDGTSLYDCSST